MFRELWLFSILVTGIFLHYGWFDLLPAVLMYVVAVVSSFWIVDQQLFDIPMISFTGIIPKNNMCAVECDDLSVEGARITKLYILPADACVYVCIHCYEWVKQKVSELTEGSCFYTTQNCLSFESMEVRHDGLVTFVVERQEYYPYNGTPFVRTRCISAEDIPRTLISYKGEIMTMIECFKRIMDVPTIDMKNINTINDLNTIIGVHLQKMKKIKTITVRKNSTADKSLYDKFICVCHFMAFMYFFINILIRGYITNLIFCVTSLFILFISF